MVGAPTTLRRRDIGAWHDGGVRGPCVREFLGWGSSDEELGVDAGVIWDGRDLISREEPGGTFMPPATGYEG